MMGIIPHFAGRQFPTFGMFPAGALFLPQPSISRVNLRTTVTSAAFRSDILDGFRAVPVSGMDIPPSPRQRNYREQETEDDNAIYAAARIVFLHVSRNLPAVVCVTMLGQEFIGPVWLSQISSN
jgi:hypothetical protein